MKRIKAACLEQTVHFQLKDDLGHAAAARAVKEEYEHYKMQLERSRTRYKIVEETVQPDDSILIKIKKQYNHQRQSWIRLYFEQWDNDKLIRNSQRVCNTLWSFFENETGAVNSLMTVPVSDTLKSPSFL